MQSQSTLLHQSIEDNDPISFIKLVIKNQPESILIEDEGTKLTILQQAALKERGDVIPWLISATTVLDAVTPLPNEQCFALDDSRLRALRNEEKTPLLLALENQKCFDIAPDILLALGCSPKKALKYCTDVQMREQLSQLKVDSDIFRGLLFWSVIHDKGEALFPHLCAQLVQAKSAKIVLDEKSVPNQSNVALQLAIQDVYGLIELSAFLKYSAQTNKLMIMSQNKIRLNHSIKTVNHWAIHHDLKDLYPILNDDNVIDVLSESDLKLLSLDQIHIYNSMQVGDLKFEELQAKRYSDSDFFAVLNYAYKYSDFVAVNSILQVYLQKENVPELFKQILINGSRDLFYLALFVTDQSIRKIALDLPNQVQAIYQMVDKRHALLASPVLSSDLSLSSKLELLDNCLTAINDSITQYKKCHRFNDLRWYKKFYLFTPLTSMLSVVGLSLANTVCVDKGHEKDSFVPLFVTGLILGCQSLAGIVYLLTTRGLDFKDIFGNQGHKTIYAIPNHDAARLAMQRVIAKFEVLSDFKVTTESTIAEFKAGIAVTQVSVKKLYENYGIFSNRPAVIRIEPALDEIAAPTSGGQVGYQLLAS